MRDCEHCSESFEDEAAYLRHLGDEHPGEMGPIERRRLDELGGGESGPSTPLLVAGIAVGALLLAVVLYTLTIGGSGGGGDGDLGELGPAPDPPHELGPPGNDQVYRPYGIDSVHSHGPISVTVDGQQIDFRKPEFQHPGEIYAFHFEGGERRYHIHAQGVTLEFALEATAFGVTNTSFAYDGVVYREGSNATAPDGWEVVTGATVVYEVNGEPVAPETYLLEDGDRITVRVERPDNASTNGTTTNASALA